MSQPLRFANRGAAVAAVVVLALGVSACGNDSAAAPAAPTTAAPTTTTTSATDSLDQATPTDTTPETTSTDHDSIAEHSMAEHSMAGDSIPHDSMPHDSMADSGMDHASTDDIAMAAMVWPRPWDPAEPIDFSGVPGVSVEQEAFAEDLVARTLVDLPQFADVTQLNDLGYYSIGDAGTGHEHYINASYLNDDHTLDPNYPESLVFEVDGDNRTLVSAMFMTTDMAVDDPELEAIGGPLMQWHVHNDLCWELTPDGPQVAGIHGPGEPCPEGQIAFASGSPMVHVWIAPHPCGPFASLEGVGAGQVNPDAEVRMDQCHEEH